MNFTVKQTLNWCNKLRKEQGLDPLSDLPKGRQNDAASCPCGKATGWTVGIFTATQKDTSIRLPKSVSRFVCQFDQGKFPKYVEKI